MLNEPIELQPQRSAPLVASTPTVSPNEHMERFGLAEKPEDDGLPPQDRGRKAWTFIAAAFVLDWGFNYAFSAVLVWFRANEPWSQYSLATLSAIPTIQSALTYFLPILVVNGFRRYPEYAKPALLISAVLFSLSMFAASFATKIEHLILLQGVVCGTTGAVMYAPTVMHLNAWFVHRRGLASGIIFAGTGIGGATFPFLISKLLDKYGFVGMTRVWSAVVGVASIGSVLVLQPRVPPVKPKDGKREKLFLLDLSIIKSTSFWIMSATIFLSSLAYFPTSLYLATFTSSVLHSSSLLLPSVVVAAFNASAFLGSPIIGAAADRSLEFTIISLGLAGTVFALGAWGSSSSLAGILTFAVLYGFGSRITSYFGPAAKEISGSNPHASATVLCFFSIFRGVASLAGPFIAASLYEEKYSDSDDGTWGRYGFEKVIIFVGVMSFLSAIGGVTMRMVRKKRVVA
ncbi:hypothetical protein JCM5353_009052 [Sporobolomyces roseus]